MENLRPSLTCTLAGYPMPLMSALGEEIRRLRKARGLRQTEVAQAIGVSAAQVSQWEGDRGVSVKNLAALAAALGTTAAHLEQFGGVYDPNAPRTTRRQRGSATDVTATRLTRSATGPILPPSADEAGEASASMQERFVHGVCVALSPERRQQLVEVAARLMSEQLAEVQRVPDGKARARR
jgi:transcriptional regulator with XRE-family HTH domain